LQQQSIHHLKTD